MELKASRKDAALCQKPQGYADSALRYRGSPALQAMPFKSY